MESLIDYTANGGNILIFGVSNPDDTIRVSPFDVFRRQIRIAGSHSLNHNIPQALDVLSRSGDVMKQVISHRLDLEEVIPFLKQEAGKASMKVQFKVG